MMIYGCAIAADSAIMVLPAAADDPEELRARFGQISIAYGRRGNPVPKTERGEGDDYPDGGGGSNLLWILGGEPVFPPAGME